MHLLHALIMPLAHLKTAHLVVGVQKDGREPFVNTVLPLATYMILYLQNNINFDECLRSYFHFCFVTDVDECLNSPCFNGGTCVNIVGSYQCQCPPEVRGKDCEQGL